MQLFQFHHEMFPHKFFLRILFIYLFERGGKEGRKGEKHRRARETLTLTRHQPETWPTIQACALTGNQTGDLSTHRPVLNALSHTSGA